MVTASSPARPLSASASPTDSSISVAKVAALCYLGDGAVNQGAFHESLNLAALFDIPVVYIIENNGYSMGTSQERSSSYGGCLAQRAEAYGMAWDVIDGSDIYEVRAKTHIAMERARKEHKPALLEIDTYRYYGHSIADANHKKYRTPEEIENYKQNHDPISVFRRKLIAEGILTEDSATAINKAAAEEAAASVKFADESPAPNHRRHQHRCLLGDRSQHSGLAKSAAISSTS